MKTNLLLKLLLGCGLMVFSAQSRAQSDYKDQAEILNINTAGFYQVTLSPQIIAKCKADLSDIRIVDQSGQAVPYIMQRDLPVNSRHTFIAFPISNNFVGNVLESVIIINKNLTSVKNLCLQIKNNDVERSINILGSDDNQKWYAISENIKLSGSPNNNGFYEQCIPIPLSNYLYIKIPVNVKNKTPFNILKAGIYTDDQYSGKYQTLPTPVASQKDSANVSYLKLKFDENHGINKLHLNISGPKFYKRDIRLYSVDESGSHFIISDQLDSKTTSDILLNARAKQISIEISNQDNPPLKITSATAYQLSQSLLSYLEAGKKYRVIFGDSTAKQPDYDLRFFTDSLNKNLKIAELGVITPNTDRKATAPLKPDFNFTYMMWGAIIIIILALAFFTYKMANEVKAKNS